MVIVEVSVVPVGTKTPSVSRYVARAVKALRQERGVKYQLTAMGTILEGELNQVLEAVKKMHESLFDRTVVELIGKRHNSRLTGFCYVYNFFKEVGKQFIFRFIERRVGCELLPLKCLM